MIRLLPSSARSRFAAVALVALIAAATAQTANASQIRLIAGLNTDEAVLTWGWHEADTRNSLDMVNNVGQTSYLAVKWKSIRTAGSVKVRVTTVAYTGLCTGVRMDVQNDVTNAQLGDYWYVHISPNVPVGTQWKDGQGWTTQPVGAVLADEIAQCKYHDPPLWTGVHLHQGGESYTTPLSGNGKWHEGAAGDGQVIDPTFGVEEPDDNWIHQYQY